MAHYHEPAQELSKQARDFTRALNSLKEEVEAVDWYHQRVDTTEDEELKALLAHNRDEEIEHACMTLEWLRKNMPGWDEELRRWLFKEGSVIEGEEEGTEDKDKDLGIGKINNK